jgi:REP element-mobilizing transposase RayT
MECAFMIHGYHLILSCYGFWLPRDPRGNWSQMIRKWELCRFGPKQEPEEPRSLRELTSVELSAREAARSSLAYPPVQLAGNQAAAVGRGFAQIAASAKYTIWACSILPEHTHLVIARHSYGVEQMANLLKGAATRQLVKEQCHPLAPFGKSGRRPPQVWSEHEWKVYLDSEQAIETAIAYVEQNPIKEGKPKQAWKLVTPFAGIPRGGWITYH